MDASEADFVQSGSAHAVVLSRDDGFADALAGGPLAAAAGGPLLLTGPAALAPTAQAEIQRVLPSGGTVYLLGGTQALSTQIKDTLKQLGYQTERLAGADRFATAAQVARAVGSPAAVFEATGLDFADALAGVPAAISRHGVIVLTDGSAPSPETTAYLSQLAPGIPRYALGGPAAAADPSAQALAGADRYATASLVDANFFSSPGAIGAASATSFPDALGAGPFLGRLDAPLVLVPPNGVLPAGVSAYLATLPANVATGELFGGPLAVSDEVLRQVEAQG